MYNNEVIPYDKHTENRQNLKQLINIYEGKANKNFKGTLSATYYSNKKNSKEIEKIKNKCLYIKIIFSINFLIELILLMIYGLYLNVSSNSILAVICISANIIFLIIGIISLIKS